MFQSDAELRLYRLLSTLDDQFTIIHSCPWLRASIKRLYSKELLSHVEFYRNNKKNISGEIDFVICHPEYGILCVEAKGGVYQFQGGQFLHKSGEYSIDPLSQVKNNAFATIAMLDEKKVSCPVGYCLYFPNTDVDVATLPSGYRPIQEDSLTDGIFILNRHEHDISNRILEIFGFWRRALRPGNHRSHDFTNQIDAFIQTVWPNEVRDNSVGRTIICDQKLWLRLDKRQLNTVHECIRQKNCLVTGFAGTGKTIIATTVATIKANAGKRVLLLFKNKKIARYVQNELAALLFPGKIEVLTFHAFCQSAYASTAKSLFNEIDKGYNNHHLYLQDLKDCRFDILIVDEAQGLNEKDHLSLAAHFGNAERYIFADKYQTLVPLEEGTSYSSLQAIYDTSTFNLSAVYRNPYRVTEEVLNMIEVDHEVINVRGEGAESFEALFSWNVIKTVKQKIESLVDGGCAYDDIIVLTQFDESIPGLPVAISTIAAYRGMEKPIVLIIPDPTTDDRALACALSRCTTKAIVAVDATIVALNPSTIRSSYIRAKLLEKKEDLVESDKARDRPALIKHIIRKIGQARARHSFGNVVFAYLQPWKTWIAYCQDAPNLTSILWARFLENVSGVKVRQIKPENNVIGSDCRISFCVECGILTPHAWGSHICLACVESARDIDHIEEIASLSNDFASLVMPGNQSLLNVLTLTYEVSGGGEQAVEEVGRLGRDDYIYFGSALIYHHMAVQKTDRCSKDEIEQWLAASLVAEEFGLEIGRIVSSTIGSMCSRKIMCRIGPRQYKLIAE